MCVRAGQGHTLKHALPHERLHRGGGDRGQRDAQQLLRGGAQPVAGGEECGEAAEAPPGFAVGRQRTGRDGPIKTREHTKGG